MRDLGTVLVNVIFSE